MIYVKEKTTHSSLIDRRIEPMKPVEDLVRESMKSLKPCIHGGEVLDAAGESGLKREEILDFSSSVNPLGPSKKALEAAKAAFNEIPAYPDSNSSELRRAIGSRFSDIGGENVVVGNGSTELMYLFAEVFLKDGEKALIPVPTFGEYESAVRKTGETVKLLRLDSNFNIDPDVFKSELASAKIVFLCNPNNPTSMLIPNETLTGIIEAALNRDVLVFLDEDFLEFVENESTLSLISKIKRYPNLFILRSFTKIFGLTGLRVGYGIANEEIINALSCAKIPWNVNCLAQAAAVAALKDEGHLAVTRDLIKKEKAWILAEFERFSSFKVYPADANFFFVDVRQSGLTSTQLAKGLLHQGILIRDCASFRGLDQYYIRVAVKTHSENARLIEALKRTVKNQHA